jgi:hypothetical protein
MNSEWPADSAAGGAPVEEEKAGKPQDVEFARVFASYGGARVTTWMRTKSPRTPKRPKTREKPARMTKFFDIITMHERIRAYTNREEGTLPTDKELMDFGTDLFETLFQGDVRRLYDEARSRQRGRKLDLVLTSMIPC